MLAKLIKYEFRATARIFLPFYLVLIVFAFINRFFSMETMVRLESTMVQFQITSLMGVMYLLLRVAYFALIVAILVTTLLVMIQRFYKNLLGDEGYLMFTLPVHPWQHIVSKLTAAVAWTLSSCLVTLLSIVILAAQAGFWSYFLETMRMIGEALGAAGCILYPGTALAGLISGMLMIYAALALGHLYSRHRILASFAWYCGLYVALAALTIVLLILLAPEYALKINEAAKPAIYIQRLIIWTTLLPSAAMGAFYFWLTDTILKRRLNLE